jgi:hypothetical protein
MRVRRRIVAAPSRPSVMIHLPDQSLQPYQELVIQRAADLSAAPP